MGNLLRALVREKPFPAKNSDLQYLREMIMDYSKLREFEVTQDLKLSRELKLDLPDVRVTLDSIETATTTITASNPKEIQPGKTISYGKNTYKIMALLGKGANGGVYKVKNTKTGEISALKIAARKRIKKVRSGTHFNFVEERQGKKIVDEINIHKQLHHKNIMELYDYAKTDDFIMIRMEYVEGKELLGESDKLNKDQKISIIGETISAISYMHSLGIYHLDLKPENALVTDKDRIVKIFDFGFSIQTSKDGKSGIKEYAFGKRFGTPECTPPQIWDREGISRRRLNEIESFALGNFIQRLLGNGEDGVQSAPWRTARNRVSKYHQIALEKITTDRIIDKEFYKKLIDKQHTSISISCSFRGNVNLCP